MAVEYAAGSSAGTSRYQRYVSSVHARSHFFSSSSVPFWSGYVVFVNGSTPLRGDAHFAASCLQAGSSPPHWARATLRTANGIQRNRHLSRETRRSEQACRQRTMGPPPASSRNATLVS